MIFSNNSPPVQSLTNSNFKPFVIEITLSQENNVFHLERIHTISLYLDDPIEVSNLTTA